MLCPIAANTGLGCSSVGCPLIKQRSQATCRFQTSNLTHTLLLRADDLVQLAASGQQTLFALVPTKARHAVHAASLVERVAAKLSVFHHHNPRGLPRLEVTPAMTIEPIERDPSIRHSSVGRSLGMRLASPLVCSGCSCQCTPAAGTTALRSTAACPRMGV